MTQKTFLVVQSQDSYPCSYLPKQQARSIYIDPREELDVGSLSLLSRFGFRRSGRLLYKPNCQNCQACQSARLRSAQFQPNRSQKRILKRNADLTLSIEEPSLAFYPLYESYIQGRHQDGDMYPPTPQQFVDFLLSDYGNTAFLVARQQEQVLACMVFDCLEDGVSAVYCFYDPHLQERSLGSFMIMRLTTLCLWLNLPFNYLGYFVPDSDKMQYKKHYQPLELFYNESWHPY